MAEESEDFRRLREALGMQADLAEEELRCSRQRRSRHFEGS